uniref:Si:ch211-129p13.1 n=1 Tax=Cyprinus carpio carpio TaxID=630221 RepID=A0A9J8DHY4_CYPCA
MKGGLTSDEIQNSGHMDCDVQYAELDTAALASSPSPRSSVHTGGDLVETLGTKNYRTQLTM